MTERFSFVVDGERLTALAYRAKKPIGATLLLGHGASGGQRDAFVTEYATGLAERGVLVVTYDFPFVEHGRREPDRDEVLQAACRAAIVAARQCRPKNRLFVGGKSLGGRVASQVVAAGGTEVEDVAGVIVLGYPLHPLGKSRTSRAHHLADVDVPVLFVQGTRDPFGTPTELRALLDGLPEGSAIHAVDGGDHSFAVTRRAHLTQREVEEGIQDEIARFIAAIASRPQVTRARPKSIAARIGTQLRALRRTALVGNERGPTKAQSLRKKARKTRAEKLGEQHETKHAGDKASYALEVPSAEARSSRKSTRSSANRAKPDTNLNLREEREKGSPKNRFRKAKTRASRVRGAPAA